ncbi:MAG: MmcQ/YjbR family DNA-binding protein [Gammaproteobacteria bacterium]|nr:MAG: MmcQ/YjbR family DNA-binding protein [Gammaproteobacteria bacterium]
MPPYVGPRGWLGVELAQRLGWDRVVGLLRTAYEEVAPAALRSRIESSGPIEPPTDDLHPEQIDPLAAALIERLRPFCLELPEVREARQFGNPAWQAGKKTFCTVSRYERRLEVHGWVGKEAQAMMTFDERYRVPAYTGHNGWIALSAEDAVLWEAVTALVLGSY